jgi:hypothetical protein
MQVCPPSRQTTQWDGGYNLRAGVGAPLVRTPAKWVGYNKAKKDTEQIKGLKIMLGYFCK